MANSCLNAEKVTSFPIHQCAQCLVPDVLDDHGFGEACGATRVDVQKVVHDPD